MQSHPNLFKSQTVGTRNFYEDRAGLPAEPHHDALADAKRQSHVADLGLKVRGREAARSALAKGKDQQIIDISDSEGPGSDDIENADAPEAWNDADNPKTNSAEKVIAEGTVSKITQQYANNAERRTKVRSSPVRAGADVSEDEMDVLGSQPLREQRRNLVSSMTSRNTPASSSTTKSTLTNEKKRTREPPNTKLHLPVHAVFALQNQIDAELVFPSKITPTDVICLQRSNGLGKICEFKLLDISSLELPHPDQHNQSFIGLSLDQSSSFGKRLTKDGRDRESIVSLIFCLLFCLPLIAPCNSETLHTARRDSPRVQSRKVQETGKGSSGPQENAIRFRDSVYNVSSYLLRLPLTWLKGAISAIADVTHSMMPSKRLKIMLLIIKVLISRIVNLQTKGLQLSQDSSNSDKIRIRRVHLLLWQKRDQGTAQITRQ